MDLKSVWIGWNLKLEKSGYCWKFFCVFQPNLPKSIPIVLEIVFQVSSFKLFWEKNFFWLILMDGSSDISPNCYHKLNFVYLGYLQYLDHLKNLEYQLVIDAIILNFYLLKRTISWIFTCYRGQYIEYLHII